MKLIRREEVEKHNVGRGPEKSVWTIIHDKVYNVTKFLDEVRTAGAVERSNAPLAASWRGGDPYRECRFGRYREF